MSSKRKKPSRITLILEAQQRVAEAHNKLLAMNSLDAGFADALNEYRDAIEARAEAEMQK